jgi:fructosamine-3-kinase
VTLPFSGELGARLGARVLAVDPISGGDAARSFRVRVQPEEGPPRTVFVKTLATTAGRSTGGAVAVFTREAEGLAWLAGAGAVRIPRVLAVDDGFLALEWIDPAPPAADHDERLGRALAALHRAGSAGFGGPHDNMVGALTQDNTPAGSWPEFYGRRRIAPLVRRAVAEGRLPGDALDAADRLIARLPELTGPPEPPARLHGDLWAGNALTDERGHPVLIDPAAYGGHREVDLAMMRLFGGFGPRVFAAYTEAHPLASGHGDRVELYQLYPLLVHTLLFGGGYGRSALAVLRRHA